MTQLATERPAQGRIRPALHWGIYDQHMGAWCSLAVGPGCFEPLEWKTAQEASQWLYLCRVAWGSGLVDAPTGRQH
jgi:hypothetical protein